MLSTPWVFQHIPAYFKKDGKMLTVPDDTDLIGFFLSEPTQDSVPEDGLYVYQATDKLGVTLVFSFHEIECSCQARLFVQNIEVAYFSQEGAQRITLQSDLSGESLICDFKIDSSVGRAEIRLTPQINVHWSTLVDR